MQVWCHGLMLTWKLLKQPYVMSDVMSLCLTHLTLGARQQIPLLDLWVGHSPSSGSSFAPIPDLCDPRDFFLLAPAQRELWVEDLSCFSFFPSTCTSMWNACNFLPRFPFPLWQPFLSLLCRWGGSEVADLPSAPPTTPNTGSVKQNCSYVSEVCLAAQPPERFTCHSISGCRCNKFMGSLWLAEHVCMQMLILKGDWLHLAWRAS